jgi:hypothetical protein
MQQNFYEISFIFACKQYIFSNSVTKVILLQAELSLVVNKQDQRTIKKATFRSF